MTPFDSFSLIFSQKNDGEQYAWQCQCRICNHSPCRQVGRAMITQSDSGRNASTIVVRQQSKAKWTWFRPPRVPPGSSPRWQIELRFFSLVPWTRYRFGYRSGLKGVYSIRMSLECPFSKRIKTLTIPDPSKISAWVNRTESL